MGEAGIGWIAAIIIGGLAGWIASNVMKSDTGIVMNIILGIVGAAIASALLRFWASSASASAGGWAIWWPALSAPVSSSGAPGRFAVRDRRSLWLAVEASALGTCPEGDSEPCF